MTVFPEFSSKQAALPPDTTSSNPPAKKTTVLALPVEVIATTLSYLPSQKERACAGLTSSKFRDAFLHSRLETPFFLQKRVFTDSHSITFSPDGKSIATASADTTARVWTSEEAAFLEGQVRFLQENKERVSSSDSEIADFIATRAFEKISFIIRNSVAEGALERFLELQFNLIATELTLIEQKLVLKNLQEKVPEGASDNDKLALTAFFEKL